MMTLHHSPQEGLLQLLTGIREEPLNQDALERLRQLSWKKLLERGLPTTQEEVFRYVGLRKFFAKQFSVAAPSVVSEEEITALIPAECQGSALVFVNGQYTPQLSRLTNLPGVAVESLTTAFGRYSSFIAGQWQRSVKGDNDPFTLINGALHSEGAFVYIPAGCVVKVPLLVLNVIDSQEEPILVMPRLHVFVGSGAQAEVLTKQATLSGAGFCTIHVGEYALEENARLTVLQLADDERQGSWYFDAIRCSVKRDGYFKAVNIVDGGEGTRFDYRVALIGENGEADISGLAMLDGSSEAHVHVLMEHCAPYCRSMQLFKNVVRGNSKTSFEGKIFVEKEAQKTDAFQLNNNLVLSATAQAFSKPNLEIFADDVKASHGATVGQLDEEQLFYLKARGFDDHAAQSALIGGFCQEILDKMDIGSINLETAAIVAKYSAQ